jgi:hypothetical protein
VLELFSPLNIKGLDIDEDVNSDQRNYCWKMWRKVHACMNLCTEYAARNNIIYNYIIRSRPDLMIKEYINFDILNPLVDRLIVGFGSTLGYPDDQFAIAAPCVMHHYCDIQKVIKHDLLPHKVVEYTLNVYPVFARCQISIIRFDHRMEKFDHIPVVKRYINRALREVKYELMHLKPYNEFKIADMNYG